jgi:hypothetical protein
MCLRLAAGALLSSILTMCSSHLSLDEPSGSAREFMESMKVFSCVSVQCGSQGLDMGLWTANSEMGLP